MHPLPALAYTSDTPQQHTLLTLERRLLEKLLRWAKDYPVPDEKVSHGFDFRFGHIKSFCNFFDKLAFTNGFIAQDFENLLRDSAKGLYVYGSLCGVNGVWDKLFYEVFLISKCRNLLSEFSNPLASAVAFSPAP